MRQTLRIVTCLSALSGCYTIARGRAATGPNTGEVSLGIQLVAPKPPLGFTAVFTSEDVVGGVLYIPDEDTPVMTHAGVLWRFGDEAVGVEFGAEAVAGDFLLGVGVQATGGQAGSQAAFLTLGFDLWTLCGSGCGYGLNALNR